MKLAKRVNVWWIVDIPDLDGRPPIECGPYASRGEADDDRQGLRRFFQDCRKTRLAGVDKACTLALD